MASAESEVESSHFLAGFRALATSADPQTRENCAAGFAAVLRTATARRSVLLTPMARKPLVPNWYLCRPQREVRLTNGFNGVFDVPEGFEPWA